MREIGEFDDIFRRYYAQLYFFALQFVEDAEECRDIVSAAYEDAWRSFAQIRRDAARAWLYANVRNKCVDFLRREEHRRRYAEMVATLSQTWVSDSDIADMQQRQRLVERLVASLPVTTRRIFTACYVDHLRYKDVAAQMGISVNTVKKHVVKALKILKNRTRFAVGDVIDTEVGIYGARTEWGSTVRWTD